MTPSPSCGCKIIEIRRSVRFKDGLAKIEYCPTHAQAFALSMKYYKHQDFGLFKVKVPHPRRVTTETGFTTVYDPETQENIKLFIDVEAIVNQIGVRAIRSKSGRAKYMHGAIIVAKAEGR